MIWTQIGAGYTNEQGQKVAVIDPELVPSGVILDAELTLATPERLWCAYLSEFIWAIT
jgi:alcohol dehydrogenase class IV